MKPKDDSCANKRVRLNYKLYDVIKKGDRMTRKPRIHYERALYHVMVRGNNKSYIFDNENDNLEYLKRVNKYSEVYAYVIMDNHVHLLMEVSKTPLSKIM